MNIFRRLFGLRNTGGTLPSEAERVKRTDREGTASQASDKRHRAGVNRQDSRSTPDTEPKATPKDLRDAIEAGNIARCEELLKLNPALVNDGSLLHTAVKYKQTVIVKRLVALGADVNAKEKGGFTPLHNAAISGDSSIASLLIAAGAEVNARTKNGRTPLHTTGRREVAQVLIDAGADVHARDRKGSTPLHDEAGSYSKTDLAEFLLSHGADSNAPDSRGQTPLHRAAYYFQPEIVKVLLEHGADPNAKDGEGHTPLYVASRDLRGDEIFVLANQPKPEAIREVLDLLRKHEGKGEQESCTACGGRVQAPPRTEPRIINCTCGEYVTIRESDIDKVKGIMVFHSTCGRTLYIPPTVWCQVCQRNLVPNWTSLIVVERAADAAREATDPTVKAIRHLAREMILGHGELVEVRCVQGPTPSWRIELVFADGLETVITESQGTTPNITWMRFGYFGQGPELFHAFLNEAGYSVTYEEIAAMKAGAVLRHQGKG